MRILPKSEFKRNVLILTIGTGIAQSLMVLTSPILTRLFTPEDFGLFAIFVSISSILSIIATGKYDLAIILPEKDEDAVNIVSLTFIITAIISGIFLIIFFIFNSQIAKLFGSEEISFWLYFIPLNIFMGCLTVTFFNWLTRNKRFKALAYNKIILIIISVCLKIILGYIGFGLKGLFIALFSSQLLTFFILIFQIWIKDKNQLNLINQQKMKEQAIKYKDFPKFTVLSVLINTLANQLPIVLFGIFFSPVIAGLYALTQRVLGVPMQLIAGSISDVFRQRSASDYAKYGNCHHIFLKTLKTLIIFSFIPFLTLFITAPDLFAFTFGANWREAGVYARILSFLWFFRFFASPLSYIFFVADKQRLNFLFQLLILFASVGSILLGVYFSDVKFSLIFFSASYSIIYLFYLFYSHKFSKGVKT